MKHRAFSIATLMFFVAIAAVKDRFDVIVFGLLDSLPVRDERRRRTSRFHRSAQKAGARAQFPCDE